MRLQLVENVHCRGEQCSPVPVYRVRNLPEKALLRQVGRRTMFTPTNTVTQTPHKKRGIAAPLFGMEIHGYGENQAFARAVPRAAQAVSASPSGAPFAITGSTTMRAPAASASSAQVRIHSPSPQP